MSHPVKVWQLLVLKNSAVVINQTITHLLENHTSFNLPFSHCKTQQGNQTDTIINIFDCACQLLPGAQLLVSIWSLGHVAKTEQRRHPVPVLWPSPLAQFCGPVLWPSSVAQIYAPGLWPGLVPILPQLTRLEWDRKCASPVLECEGWPGDGHLPLVSPQVHWPCGHYLTWWQGEWAGLRAQHVHLS